MALVPPLRWSWKASSITVDETALHEAHLDFLIDLDEAAIEAHPDDVEVLSRLGETYTRRGRHAEGLAIDRRIVSLLPEDATAHYNLACSFALTGQVDEAFEALKGAVEHGYADEAHLLADDDLAALHGDPRWQALIDRLKTL